MSEFVNYNKRSVDLPSGCKDLYDVLRQGELRPVQRATILNRLPFVTKGGQEIADLSKIEKYVARMLRPGIRAFTLRLSLISGQITVCIAREFDQKMRGFISGQMDKDQRQKLREFMTCRGFLFPADSDSPAQLYDLSPLPITAPLLSELLVTLFREVGGLGNDDFLCFRDTEYSNTA